MNVDPEGTWDWGVFWSALALAASFIMAIVGAVLVATGVFAPLGAILMGAGLGGLVSGIGSIISQGIDKGFGNINWGRVAFDTGMGALIGGISASGLGPIASGLIVGGLAFVQSVVDDLFDSNWDWSKINWLKAVAVGALSGVFAGVSKTFGNISDGFHNIDGIPGARTPVSILLSVITRVCSAISHIISVIGDIITKIIGTTKQRG